MYIDTQGKLCLTRFLPNLNNAIWGIEEELCLSQWKVINEDQLTQKQKERVDELKKKGYKINIIAKSLLTNRVFIEYSNPNFQDFEIL